MSAQITRLRIVVRGRVQGVGFRPYIHHLAQTEGLAGFVQNTREGVVLEVEGARRAVENLLMRLKPETPPPGLITGLEPRLLDPIGLSGFEIRKSIAGLDSGRTHIPADLATCLECHAELFDPPNRRYRYPFTNCTHCGPRYSIIRDMPYDRSNTSMDIFKMCLACRREYEDPTNRRFHAQPNACPVCGPRLTLYKDGKPIAEKEDALRAVRDALVEGRIVAIKGLGGFQLMVDARNEDAVRRLRSRKLREEKPLAVMFPALSDIQQCCVVNSLEQRLLQSAESPIVLLRQKPETGIAASVAPGNPWLGAMLPYTPLHYLLLYDFDGPLVATSGNRTDEPICIDNNEALERLGDIADLILLHDRPILRHVDDSVVRIALGRECVMRRARGYAPEPVDVGFAGEPCLGVGGHYKNTIALSVGSEVFVSQHIGDLDGTRSLDALDQTVSDLLGLLHVTPVRYVCDRHPDYASSRHAHVAGAAPLTVQHHHAHIVACMAENELPGPVLGFSWDGTGLGDDNVIWGGECLLASRTQYKHVAGLRTFRLAGGDAAMRKPSRTALCLLVEALGADVLEDTLLLDRLGLKLGEARTIVDASKKGINAPLCSSMGRLFDGVAAILQLQQKCSFEGQAAMRLEHAVLPEFTGRPYPIPLRVSEGTSGPEWVMDWVPMLRTLLGDVHAGVAAAECATRFHEGLIEAMATVAREMDEPRIVLTGGCFQNMILLERGFERLTSLGFKVYAHQRVPPNDGGLALGQVVYAMALGQHSKPLPNLFLRREGRQVCV